MTPAEWMEWYEAHGGTKDLKLDPSETIVYHPEHGFVTFMLDFEEKSIEGHHIVGDGRFWWEYLCKLARELGFTRGRFFTRRNPKAWMRKYGGHIRGYYMEVDWGDVK